MVTTISLALVQNSEAAQYYCDQWPPPGTLGSLVRTHPRPAHLTPVCHFDQVTSSVRMSLVLSTCN